jgi:hypothetical protein
MRAIRLAAILSLAPAAKRTGAAGGHPYVDRFGGVAGFSYLVGGYA